VLLIPVVPVVEEPEHAISVGKANGVDLDHPAVPRSERPVEREESVGHRPDERLDLPANEFRERCERDEDAGSADVWVLGMRREIANDPLQ